MKENSHGILYKPIKPQHWAEAPYTVEIAILTDVRKNLSVVELEDIIKVHYDEGIFTWNN